MEKKKLTRAELAKYADEMYGLSCTAMDIIAKLDNLSAQVNNLDSLESCNDLFKEIVSYRSADVNGKRFYWIADAILYKIMEQEYKIGKKDNSLWNKTKQFFATNRVGEMSSLDYTMSNK